VCISFYYLLSYYINIFAEVFFKIVINVLTQ